MNYKNMTDAALMEVFYNCENKAFDELYRRYRAQLEQWFCNCGLSEAEAQDIVQDTFVRVLETKHPPPGREAKPYNPSIASFKTWLFKIAYNLLNDFKAKHGRIVDFTSLEPKAKGEGGEGEEEPCEATIRSKELSPVDRAVEKEKRQAVHDCMKTLPDRERIVIALWLETDGDMKLEDLANILDVSVSTASRVLKEARDLMGKCLKRKGYPEARLPESKPSETRE